MANAAALYSSLAFLWLGELGSGQAGPASEGLALASDGPGEAHLFFDETLDWRFQTPEPATFVDSVLDATEDVIARNGRVAHAQQTESRSAIFAVLSEGASLDEALAKALDKGGSPRRGALIAFLASRATTEPLPSRAKGTVVQWLKHAAGGAGSLIDDPFVAMAASIVTPVDGGSFLAERTFVAGQNLLGVPLPPVLAPISPVSPSQFVFRALVAKGALEPQAVTARLRTIRANPKVHWSQRTAAAKGLSDLFPSQAGAPADSLEP